MSELRKALRGVDREIAKEVRAAVERGWRVRPGGRHVMLLHDDGRRMVTVSRTPSDVRTVKNVRAQLRTHRPDEHSCGAA